MYQKAYADSQIYRFTYIHIYTYRTVRTCTKYYTLTNTQIHTQINTYIYIYGDVYKFTLVWLIRFLVGLAEKILMRSGGSLMKIWFVFKGIRDLKNERVSKELGVEKKRTERRTRVVNRKTSEEQL